MISFKYLVVLSVGISICFNISAEANPWAQFAKQCAKATCNGIGSGVGFAIAHKIMDEAEKGLRRGPSSSAKNKDDNPIIKR